MYMYVVWSANLVARLESREAALTKKQTYKTHNNEIYNKSRMHVRKLRV